MFEIKIIKSKNKIYITDNVTDKSYHISLLDNNKYLFDGESPKPSFKKGYYEISKVPEVIQRIVPERQTLIGYELINQKYAEELNLPEFIFESDWHDSEYQYKQYLGLYRPKYEIIPETIVNVEFNIVNVLDIDTDLYKVEYNVYHYVEDELDTPEVLLQTKPCRLTKEESYKIIRNYIKQHINYEVATITSDYDFCFTVKKRVKLSNPESYEVNVGKRKPKYEVRYKHYEFVECFEMSPKAYQNYTVVKEFSGKNYEDLDKNIKSYLEDLINKINTPLKTCSCCNGLGVITDN